MTASVGRAALVSGSILAADQLTKALVRDSVERGDEQTLLPGVDLVHTANDGIAWGLFSGGGAGVIVPAATVLAVGVLLWWFWLFRDKPLVWLPIGLILGGALGNVVDRVRVGAVTDFLDIPVLPPFNVADTAITFGLLAALLAFDWTADGDERRQEADSEDARGAHKGAV